MNKLYWLIGIILSLFLFSCHTVTVRTTLYDKIINQSNKDIVYFIDANIGKNSATVAPFDSTSIEMEYKNEFTESILAYEVFPHLVDYNQIIIYNLTDTTNINMVKMQEIAQTDTTFSSHFNSKLDGNSNNMSVFNTTIIDGYILEKFSKDYTMLEKFKEYYKR